MLDQISWSGGAATFSWDALGRRDTVLLTNGHETIYQYDADGRIRRAKSKFGSITVFDRQYEAYDSAGRVLQFDDTGDRFGAGHSRRYMVYDGRGQLRKELTDNGAAVGSIMDYDAVGNRTRVAGRCASGWVSCPDTTDYTYYSGTNRVDSTRLRRFGNPIVTRHKYFYDRNGATTADRSSDDPSYTTYNYRYYDAAGRLLAGYYAATHDTVPTGMPSANAANVFYAYDALGRKVRGASPSNSGAWIFYDGENTVRLMTHEFLHGPGLDEPLITFFDSNTLINCDDSYSTAYFVTVGNRLLDYHSGGTGLSCFGNSQGQYPAWTTVGQHSGAIKDSEGPGLSRSAGNTSANDASLSFFRNRWYDSNTGRFTREDPIGFKGGLNLYAYAGNNPATYTDPFGLCPNPPCRDPNDGMRDLPLPPGVDPDEVTWDPEKKWYEHDKTGKIYRPHSEDRYHWPHWDVINPGEKRHKRYPQESVKPRPNQHKLKPGQSWTNPWDEILGPGPLERAWRKIEDWILHHPLPKFPAPVLPGPVPVPIPILVP